MFKDLIKFTAKLAILAAVTVFVIVPHIPGMPKVGDLIRLPSWQQAVKFLIDPANLIWKGPKPRAVGSLQDA